MKYLNCLKHLNIFYRKEMSITRRFFIVAACFFGMLLNALGQQFDEVRRANANLSSSYQLNRTGAQAYMQGGAFAAETGNVTAMLFNPAGLAGLSGRLTATVESGWVSETERQPFSDGELLAGFQPIQFAGIGLQPWRHFAVGMYYAQPARENFDEVTTSRIEQIIWGQPHNRHHFESPVLKREQTSLGLVLATVLGNQLYLGGGVEWRSSGVRERFFRLRTQADAEAVRFSAGAIIKVLDWRIGISGQTRYEAIGNGSYQTPARDFFNSFDPFDEAPAGSGSFVEIEPATMRLGVATPYALGRLRFNADAEYKNFDNEAPLASWQFYGGGTLKLVSNAYLSFGGFSSTKDYSNYLDDAYLTAGGIIELAQFRLSASFIDSALLAQNIAGQQFVNFALSYVIP